jgi:N6-adenosine-specific RNA methylase IME4
VLPTKPSSAKLKPLAISISRISGTASFSWTGRARAWAWSEETGFDRASDNHYPTQDFRWAIDVLASLIRKLAAPDSMLVMWSTAASLVDDIEIMAEAGFCALRPRGTEGLLLRDEAGEPLDAVSCGGGTYRSHQVWDKQSIGMGRWFRDRHEIVLIGVRGNIPCPAPGTQSPSIFSERRAEHSAKPEFVAEEIERLWPHLPKIEMFRRGAPRLGWDGWGAECDEPKLPPHGPETGEVVEAAK